ncbi:MAG TPA: hypothetical protein VK463_03815 [Desulfomonilaceae bacterium]|nr:hypothetical protein [Desulfomonilaceae bacterium]
MKKAIVVALVFFFAGVAEAQDSFTAHGATVIFHPPDLRKWNLVHKGMDAKSNKFLLMFKRSAIKDSEGREIEPVIAVICEAVLDSSDMIQYSIRKRTQVGFDVKKVLTHQDGSLTCRNAVGYEGEYEKGSVLHKVLVAHIRHKEAGLQVICDSTDGVYGKVEADMKNFLRSITFKK